MLDSVLEFLGSRSLVGIVGAISCVVIGVVGITAILVKHFRMRKAEGTSH